MKNLYIIFIFAILFGCQANGQKATIYFPWDNTLSSLIVANSSDFIPLLINGENYRVVKIHNDKNSPIVVNSFSYISQNSSGSIYYLPIINSYKGNRILDPVLEIDKLNPVRIMPNSSGYFMVKIKGKHSGRETTKINLMNDGRILLSFRLNIFVSNSVFRKSVNLNLWSYLNFGLIGDIRKNAIKDLKEHGANVLVIPANVLPPINNTVAQFSGSKINSYLNGLSGNFNHYILFLGYNSIKDQSYILSNKWKQQFKIQIAGLRRIFEKNGIDFSKVYLYPYDEPNVAQAKKEVEMINWCKDNGIANPFYSTLTNPSSVFLSKYTDIVQVNSQIKGLLNTVLNYNSNSNSSEVWLYEIKAGSRNISPINYLNLGWKANYYGVNGIGLWNYSFTGYKFNHQSFKIKRSMGSWQTKSSNQNIDYSTIYRKGNIICSSIRWEAVKMGIVDYSYLNLYKDKFGAAKKKILVSKLINGSMSIPEWEQIKLEL